MVTGHDRLHRPAGPAALFLSMERGLDDMKKIPSNEMWLLEGEDGGKKGIVTYSRRQLWDRA